MAEFGALCISRVLVASEWSQLGVKCNLEDAGWRLMGRPDNARDDVAPLERCTLLRMPARLWSSCMWQRDIMNELLPLQRQRLSQSKFRDPHQRGLSLRVDAQILPVKMIQYKRREEAGGGERTAAIARTSTGVINTASDSLPEGFVMRLR
jgi:hypothetical protein